MGVMSLQWKTPMFHSHITTMKVKHPSPVVPGIYFCSWKCLRIAMKSYHKHEKNILNDYIKQCAQDEKIERSGVLFLALKAVAKMPWQFYCDNSRSELFMKTDP